MWQYYYIYCPDYKYVKEDTKSHVAQTLNCLNYLHKIKYIHRDLKIIRVR